MEASVDVEGLGISFQVAILIASLFVVAFFSSSEAALLYLNKVRVRNLAEQGNRSAKAVMRLAEKHEKFFATILLTENAFIILASSVGTSMAISVFGKGSLAILVATGLMTVVLVMVAEITPKSVAAKFADRWALVVARPIELIMKLETVLVYAFIFPPRLIMWLLRGHTVADTPSVTEAELRMLVDIGRTEGVVEHEEAELIHQVFRFGDRRLNEVMTPRTEIVGLERGATLSQFLAVYAEHPFDRFPVYMESVDSVEGILVSRDVFQGVATGRLRQDDVVTSLAHKTYFVPETKNVADLFNEMRESGDQMAIAVDEFGGTAGLVTLHQLVEELVGRVADEGGPDEEFVTLDANTFQVEGSMRVDEANEALGLGIPEGDYETIAGFILSSLGRIPLLSEHVHHRDIVLEITEMDGLRIEQVKVTRIATPQEGEA